MIQNIIFIILAISAAKNIGVGGQTLSPCPEPPYNNLIAKVIYEKMDSLRNYMLTGFPALGIPVLDPLGPLPTLEFNINNNYLILKGSISDTFVRNLAQYIICEMFIDFGINQKFFMDLRLRDFHIDGYYDVNGLYVMLFPIFGNGSYTLDVYNASLTTGAKVSYNVITRHAQIHNLEIDIVFEDLKIYMECLLGCGMMANATSEFLSQLGEVVFYKVWDYIDPILTEVLENYINNILNNIKIPPTEYRLDQT